MQKDRAAIVTIISKMLDNPDKHEIYPTSVAYTELEQYVESARIETLGWAHANACITLDRGEDPRDIECPTIIKRAMNDLSK